MPRHRPEAVANEFLQRAGKAGLTQMQIQKLVYIAHGWTLALTDEPLTAIEPEAWDRGPVYPELRDKISHVGSKPLRETIHENDENPFAVLGSAPRGAAIRSEFNSDETTIIDRVWKRYGNLHGFRLSDLTHAQDTPWRKTYSERGRNAPIANEDTKSHYVGLAKAIVQRRQKGQN